ncbi:MAG: hypothetical protein HQM08_17445 [Candidatus Riflebacteria bacterium]|nr:hypothetical protein [Candidatus Riflebacteria bacterium]
MKIYDPTFKIQSEPPNKLTQVTSFTSQNEKVEFSFRGQNFSNWSSRFEAFTELEMAKFITAHPTNSRTIIKEPVVYPSRWEMNLSDWKKERGANIFLRYCLKGNDQWFTYEKGFVQTITDSENMMVLCLADNVSRNLPVSYLNFEASANLFQPGDCVLIYRNGPTSARVVIGFLDQPPRGGYNWAAWVTGGAGDSWSVDTNPYKRWKTGWDYRFPEFIETFYENFWYWEDHVESPIRRWYTEAFTTKDKYKLDIEVNNKVALIDLTLQLSNINPYVKAIDIDQGGNSFFAWADWNFGANPNPIFDNQIEEFPSGSEFCFAYSIPKEDGTFPFAWPMDYKRNPNFGLYHIKLQRFDNDWLDVLEFDMTGEDFTFKDIFQSEELPPLNDAITLRNGLQKYSFTNVVLEKNKNYRLQLTQTDCSIAIYRPSGGTPEFPFYSKARPYIKMTGLMMSS